MDADLATFRTQFPELSTTSDDVVQRNLELALDLHDTSARATLYLTAHLATLPLDGESPGELTSESIGPKSAEYMTQAETGDESFYTRTEYGRRFLALSRRATAGLFKVRVV